MVIQNRKCTFYDEVDKLDATSYLNALGRIGEQDVLRALSKSQLDPRDLLCLLSSSASGLLEQMAQKAHRTTLQNFGHTILLYTPLYLSSYCVNRCTYCSFSASNKFPRHRLEMDEVEKEAEAISKTGLEHILVLTGESRTYSPVTYIRDCVRLLKKYFSSISIEIYPLTNEEYGDLVTAGIDGLTIYQEAYDRSIYARVHPGGPKSDYRFRLEAPERAGNAGIRTINIGPLFGLANWRTEAFIAGLHADYLQKRFPDVEISLSVPRMRPNLSGYQPGFPVSDEELVQAVAALRLFLPRAGITLSTREGPSMRDNLVRLGVTKMSAGSSTSVGGHTMSAPETGQFEISDDRSVDEIRDAISRQGYKAIFKDWHDLHNDAKD